MHQEVRCIGQTLHRLMSLLLFLHASETMHQEVFAREELAVIMKHCHMHV
jgi:hypothetical protein